jgi:ketol-acid reductoisomerase
MTPEGQTVATGGVLAGRKIAVLGFGSQGRAQALNLRDSGCNVVVGLRTGGPSWAAAQAEGLTVARIDVAVRQAEIVMLLVPDEAQPELYENAVRPNAGPGSYLGFAHGFAIHYRALVPTPDSNVFLVAPKGIGPMVRQQYLAGGGVPALVAVHQDPSGDTHAVAHAYAAALGCDRTGIIETTFRNETETDLFGEQAVLCGGLVELIRAGFETLVAAGYAPELAYYECLHEVKLIADLIHERGLAGMRQAISRTAAYGGLTRGPRVIGPAVREELRRILAEVQTGEFARQWLAEFAAGKPHLNAAVEAEREHPIEAVSTRLSRRAARESPPRSDRDSRPGA